MIGPMPTDAPTGLLDRLIDVTARKPSGLVGRWAFRNPREHYRAFRLAEEALGLEKCGVYLEIGCGGGVLLERALGTVSKACALDHSPDMIAEARRRNRAAVMEGRLELVVGDAESLPWPDGAFSWAASTEMWFFLRRPERVLAELRRVLRPGGRLVITSVPGGRRGVPDFLLGPYRKSMRLYSDEALAAQLREAGFENVQARTHDRFHQVVVGDAPGAGAACMANTEES